MSDEKLEFLLSQWKDFDEMEGKFCVQKTHKISPRIVKLQKSLGFECGEPLNRHNFYRLIPATRNIHTILRKPGCGTPTTNQQAVKEKKEGCGLQRKKLARTLEQDFASSAQEIHLTVEQNKICALKPSVGTSNCKVQSNVSKRKKIADVSSNNLPTTSKKLNESSLNKELPDVIKPSKHSVSPLWGDLALSSPEYEKENVPELEF